MQAVVHLQLEVLVQAIIFILEEMEVTQVVLLPALRVEQEVLELLVE